MLQNFSLLLESVWGPFRLLGSHLVLLVVGTFAAGAVVFKFLPALFRFMPVDRGKTIAADGGAHSVGKPTGAGFLISLLVLPVYLLFVPFTLWGYLALGALYLCMLFGYLDDRSALPWGDIKKGVLDLAVACAAAACVYFENGSTIWLPFTKTVFTLPCWAYLVMGTLIIWGAINSTNCSDGIDGLAGTLSLVTLFSLAALMYGVIGHTDVAKYLLIPHNPLGARWAIAACITAGALAGYLWYNASPSMVMMGDAGSRFLGMLIGVIVLVSGNPFLVIVAAPMLLVNGGTGVLKIALLRVMKRLGLDTRVTRTLPPEEARRQWVLVRALHSVCFPLHDHFRKRKGWSNAQVLLRFTLLHAFLVPLLFLLLVKIR